MLPSVGFIEWGGGGDALGVLAVKHQSKYLGLSVEFLQRAMGIPILPRQSIKPSSHLMLDMSLSAEEPGLVREQPQ